jgi:hypothetical protein
MTQPNPLLVASSLLFTFPMTMGAINRQWNLYFTFLLITLISSLYHATKNKYLLPIDYTACYIVLYVMYEHTKTDYPICFIIGSGSCAILFWGGYATKRLIFSSNSVEKNVSHVLMHLIVVSTGCAASYLVPASLNLMRSP